MLDPAVTETAPVSGSVLSSDEIDRAVTAWKATGLTDDDTALLARAATSRIARELGAPITPQSVVDRYRVFDARLRLSARRLDGAAFGTGTLSALSVGVLADGLEVALEASEWALDLTGEAPALLLPSPPLAPVNAEANPVWARYHYDPLGAAASSDVAALIAHCVTIALRDEFAVRTGAMPTGARHIRDLLAPLRRLPV